MKIEKEIDELLEKDCYVIDFLPFQVSEDSSGQYFKVEKYYLNHYEEYGFKEKFINILLKIMCYYQVSIYWNEWTNKPTPEQFVKIVNDYLKTRTSVISVVIPEKEALIQFEWDSLNMQVFNPDEELSKLLKQVSLSEGLFWRKAEQ